MGARILCLLVFCLAVDGFAAKKDFKGLFGSYRREKFTENEGRSTDYGMDILLSTLLPVTSVVNSTETRGAAGTPMYYATFFNVEGSFFFTLSYHWEVMLNVGYYSYSTRKQNSTASAGLPQFQQFTMEALPVLAGLKYRFGTSDIVPYVGAGLGAAYVHRNGSYDYSGTFNDNYSTAFAAQASLGIEFFISPRAGIRLETSAMYIGVKALTFDTQGTPSLFPILLYQANPIAVRYASGLFLLF